jgi:hypothetical protein
MANIVINVSTEYGSAFRIVDSGLIRDSGLIKEGECLAFTTDVNLAGGVPFARDTVFIHGTVNDMRALFEACLAALPPLPHA